MVTHPAVGVALVLLGLAALAPFEPLALVQVEEVLGVALLQLSLLLDRQFESGLDQLGARVLNARGCRARGRLRAVRAEKEGD